MTVSVETYSVVHLREFIDGLVQLWAPLHMDSSGSSRIVVLYERRLQFRYKMLSSLLHSSRLS